MIDWIRNRFGQRVRARRDDSIISPPLRAIVNNDSDWPAQVCGSLSLADFEAVVDLMNRRDQPATTTALDTRDVE